MKRMIPRFIRSAFLCVLLVAGVAVTGCDLSAGDHSFFIQSGEAVRSYEVYVPSSYDGTAMPLVMDFHGYTTTSGAQKFISGWKSKAEEEGFIAVWPQGLGLVPSWNAETCCGEAILLGIDDVGFARDVVTDISSRVEIDPDRVYATGLSNGGALSHFLGCNAADVFAAIAPVSYPLPVFFEGSCEPSRPVPVMHFHGYSDLIVPYWTGLVPVFRSARSSREAWADINGCTDSPTTTFSRGLSSCRTHDSCDGDSEVTLCSFAGGHLLYVNLGFIDIPDLAWEFFVDHPLN